MRHRTGAACSKINPWWPTGRPPLVSGPDAPDRRRSGHRDHIRESRPWRRAGPALHPTSVARAFGQMIGARLADNENFPIARLGFREQNFEPRRNAFGQGLHVGLEGDHQGVRTIAGGRSTCLEFGLGPLEVERRRALIFQGRASAFQGCRGGFGAQGELFSQLGFGWAGQVERGSRFCRRLDLGIARLQTRPRLATPVVRTPVLSRVVDRPGAPAVEGIAPGLSVPGCDAWSSGGRMTDAISASLEGLKAGVGVRLKSKVSPSSTTVTSPLLAGRRPGTGGGGGSVHVLLSAAARVGACARVPTAFGRGRGRAGRLPGADEVLQLVQRIGQRFPARSCPPPRSPPPHPPRSTVVLRAPLSPRSPLATRARRNVRREHPLRSTRRSARYRHRRPDRPPAPSRPHPGKRRPRRPQSRASRRINQAPRHRLPGEP